MRSVIRDGVVVTMAREGQIYANGLVAWEGTRLVYVGSADGYAWQGNETVYSARGQWVLPGLVNCHSHTQMTAFRGVVDDIPLGHWLEDKVRGLEAEITVEELYWQTVLGAHELLRNGITCTADRYAHMDRCAPALYESGIRAVITSSVTDGGGKAAWDRSERVISEWGVSPSSRIWASLGPHATDTNSTELLGRIRRRADELGARIFLHVAQSQQEVDVIRGRGVDGCIRYLDQIGFLGPDVVAAHCIYLQPGEIEIMARTQTRMAHCPSSNAKIEARIAPAAAFMKAGGLVGVATDAAACNNGMDLLEEVKIAALLNNIAAGDPTFLTVEKALRLITIDAAQVLGADHEIGSLEVGKRADVITIDAEALHVQPNQPVLNHLVYASRGSDVRHVFVDGRPLLLHGQFLNFDPAEAKERVRYAGARLQNRMGMHLEGGMAIAKPS